MPMNGLREYQKPGNGGLEKRESALERRLKFFYRVRHFHTTAAVDILGNRRKPEAAKKLIRPGVIAHTSQNFRIISVTCFWCDACTPDWEE
jgi:hypothetical protein